MRKISKKLILSLFLTLTVINISQAKENQDSLLSPVSNFQIEHTYRQNPDSKHFNLANIVDSFLNNETQISTNVLDKKSQTRKEFISISSKFNQGNAKVAYDEYENLIDKIDNDVCLLNLSKIFYEIGFFSLANKATEKIVYKNQFYDNISDLEKSYKPKSLLTKEDEIFFAKQYSGIYFDNTAQENIQELLNLKNKYQKNDYYDFILSRAYLETKDTKNALNYVNKAISLNNKNINYQLFRIDILISQKKYQEAKKLIEKLEKSSLALNFIPELKIKKETVLIYTTNNEKDKKYHTVNKTFLEGNFEKAKKDCKNILTFDKNNDKITTLYAKSELANGSIERANVYFVNSYKLNKNNVDTIIGLGDIMYLHGDYKNAVKTYKKALNKDSEKDNYEIILKLAQAQRQYAKNPKELKKLEAKLDKMPKTAYMDYYSAALSIAQKNDVLKEEFLKRTLDSNPMYENALGSLIELYLKNNQFELAKGLIYNVSFTLEKNFYYYYLCGLYNQATKKNNDAIQFYKTSLNLNPNFEIANTKLLKLIPDTINEEI
mgnify:CR=1 FL=1